MTAEMFLAVFLASLLVGVVQWVFVLTVYLPVKRWLANRAWARMAKEGDASALFPGSRCIDPSGCLKNRAPESVFCREHGPGAIVTQTLARAPRIWVRKGHAHAGDRLQVFADIPGLGWKTVFDEDWPLGAMNLECLWNGGNAPALKPTREGPSSMLEEMAEDERTNGLVAMRWSGHESVSYSSGGAPFLSRWSRDGVRPNDTNTDSGSESLDIE